MKTSEIIAWVIVGGIVLLFFIGRMKNKVSTAVAATVPPTPSHPFMCSTGGDIICGVGTISAGVTEPSVPPLNIPFHTMPIIHPTFCTVCRAPVPLRILNPASSTAKPLPPVRLWGTHFIA